MNKVRVVVDTNILISSIFWSGNPYSIIQKGIEQEILIFTSEDILQELKNVLERDFEVSSTEIEDIISGFTLFLHRVEPTEKIDFVKDDPKDDIILECAVESKSHYIVSGDKHLLKLGEFRGVKIISARQFLDRQH